RRSAWRRRWRHRRARRYSRTWRWRCTRRYLVGSRGVRRRLGRAEVLREEPSTRGALHARRPVLPRGWKVVQRTHGHHELEIPMVLIQAHLVVVRRIVVGKQHRSPFDVEDTVRRAPGHRSKDTAVSTREARAATQTEIGALILPNAKDGEVIRPLV